jgi:hypothetical protein
MIRHGHIEKNYQASVAQTHVLHDETGLKFEPTVIEMMMMVRLELGLGQRVKSVRRSLSILEESSLQTSSEQRSQA